MTRRLLRQALEDPDESVRAIAKEVLDELDDEALFRVLLPAN